MKRRSAAGYTIMEVMIVLAVTGSLFASVVLLLGGRQAATEFTQSLKDFESKIQSVVNDVASGYYQSGSFSCSAGNAPFTQVTITAPPSASGTNKGCVFIGKIITTGLQGADIFTLIGRQYKGSDTSGDVANLNDSRPIAVATADADITEAYTYNFGLRIENVYRIGTTSSIGGFGFLTQLAGAGGVPSPVTGSRGVLLYRLGGTSSPNGQTRGQNATSINTTANLLPTNEGIRICVSDDGGHRGEIIVGAEASQTSTFVVEGPSISAECLNA